jgi:hypothetical protein
MRLRPIVITLTTIPPRSGALKKKLQCLGRQTVQPDAIEIYVPSNYRRFPNQAVDTRNLPSWVDVISTDSDLGPATKILPAYRKWAGRGVDLLLCDDDRVHDERWIERLMKQRLTRPDDIICERGWNIEERYSINTGEKLVPRAVEADNGGRTTLYRAKRLISVGLYHPPRQIYRSAGYVDIFEGFLGALIPPRAFDQRVHDIPDIVWTVDDVWLSGMAKLNGTGVWVHAEPRPVFSNSRADKIAALIDYTVDGVGRHNAEISCIEWFRTHHKIWS